VIKKVKEIFHGMKCMRFGMQEDERINNQSSAKKFEPVGSGEVVNQIKNQRMCDK
jgi:hypothetical protein